MFRIQAEDNEIITRCDIEYGIISSPIVLVEKTVISDDGTIIEYGWRCEVKKMTRPASDLPKPQHYYSADEIKTIIAPQDVWDDLYQMSAEKHVDRDTLWRGFYRDLQARAQKYGLRNKDDDCRKAWRYAKCRVLAKLVCLRNGIEVR